ncbi:MAG: MscL family protein, partial [Clostridia bacterium]|nr:MscL family protein [Clostridia bacterium]
ISMSDWRYILSHATEEKSEIAIKYGALIEVTLDFFLIALMLYIIIRVLTRIRNRFHQSEIERAKAEEERKKEEARIAAEQAAAQTAAFEAEKKALREEFFENAREENKILAEIRDSLKQLQNSKA